MQFTEGKQTFPLGLNHIFIQGFVIEQETISHSADVASFTITFQTHLYLQWKFFKHVYLGKNNRITGWQEEIHDLAIYQGQGTFAAKYENGTPWTHWRD